MAIAIDGENLKIEDVHRAARLREKVEIPAPVRGKVEANQRLVERLVQEGQALYGITTGIGEFSKIMISKEQSEELQKRIVYSHAAGTGNIASPEWCGLGCSCGRM